jgi:hypothetical protein
MNREQVWREFEALPLPAQQQVADFIAFLRTRSSRGVPESVSTSVDFDDDPFVGMWQDRDDLADSSTWVRNLREQEWSRHHE